MEITDLYKYDESSPSCLTWLVNVYSGRWNNHLSAIAETPAGSLGTSGYYVVYRDGKTVVAHRIIWEMFNGPIEDGLYLDHIDGNRTNNKLDNLRVVPKLLNARNCKPRTDNTSGIVGVKLSTLELKDGSVTRIWNAQWVNLEGKTKTKTFNCRKLGEDLAFELACAHRVKMIEEMNAQGAGYTERHYLKEVENDSQTIIGL